MTIALVPLPLDHVAGAAAVWLPFVESIAKHGGSDPAELVDQVVSGDVHLILIWDADEKRAHALAGLRFTRHGSGRIAEIVWLTGRARELWVSLLPDVERYVRKHQACTGIKAICRPGWSATLKSNGYKASHIVMEKGL